MTRLITIEANEQSLRQLLESVSKQAKLELLITDRALATVGKAIDKPTKVAFSNEALMDVISELRFEFPASVELRWTSKSIVLSILGEPTDATAMGAIPDWLEGAAYAIEDDRVSRVYVGDQGDEFLARLRDLSGLREVYIEGNSKLSLAGLRHLLDCKSLTKLTLHNIGKPANTKAKVSSDSVLKILSEHQTLEILSADDCGISNEGLRFLNLMPNLQWISLRQNQITDDGLKSLGRVSNLKYLDLGSYVRHVAYGKNEISDEGLKHLSGVAESLEYLGTEGNNVSLVQLCTFPQLRSLNLRSVFSEPELGNQELRLLSKLSWLEHLDLSSTELDADGLQFLTLCKNLKRLSLRSGAVGDQGIEVLEALDLQSLSLNRVNLTDRGVESISRMENLRDLALHYCTRNTTIEGLAELKKLPRLRRLVFTSLAAPGSRRPFAELKQVRSMMFEAANLTAWTQQDLDCLGQELPRTSITVGTGAAIYSPQGRQRFPASGFKIPY
ncbi:MAG: hypothetical protein ACE361_11375 [Aureliella sp.]